MNRSVRNGLAIAGMAGGLFFLGQAVASASDQVADASNSTVQDNSSTDDGGGSHRAASASKYYDERGQRVLAALDEVAAAHNVPVASVALAWLREQPNVLAPLASARKLEQVAPLLQSVTLDLSADEIAKLTEASS